VALSSDIWEILGGIQRELVCFVGIESGEHT
jgi:hypothetical protein